MTEDKNKKIRYHIELLQKGTDDQVLAQLQILKKEGSTSLLPPLFKRWSESENETLNRAIFDFLKDVRPHEALIEIMQALNENGYPNRKNELISLLWQSSLDASEYFNDLIEIALHGDFLTVLEVSTVVESFENAFNEQEILEVIYQIDEHMEETENTELKSMLNSLKTVVSQLPLEE